MPHVPANPHEIDAPWLSDALAERYPGVGVADVEIAEQHEATNNHTRLHISYAEPCDLPTTLFCKLLPCDPARRGAIAQTGMGPREARFYAKLAPHIEMRVPRVYVARHEPGDAAFVLLLEDLVTSGCGISDGTEGVSPDAAGGAIEDLAALHAHFEDPARRAAEAAWVSPPLHSDYGQVLLQSSLEQHRDRLTPRFTELAELYIERGEALHEIWQQGPRTVIHGDTHIGNLFDDAGRTGFLDWGIINLGTPLRDVSYFLTMALSVEDRRAHERDLLRLYLDFRTASGLPPISFDDAWRAHRIHAAYTVPACCQIVTFPKDISERRRVFSEAFLARAEAALEDLEPRRALREFADL
ncbi:MAG: phosphotransferase [Deltaproteobacteria bacterium]|nr:phosphotransferase [Deltaproteobacteria bacterium]MBW2363052.1 phosphotransferase [Deltaproteobacteria bacterium]